VLLEHRLVDRPQHGLAHERDESRIGVGVQRRRIRQVVAVVRPIGGVQVHRHVRIPAVQQRDERARLGALELHEVAVEVELLRVLARADAAHRAVLRRAVLHVDQLVAVGVVVGRDENDDPLQHRLQVAREQPARQDQRRFLALDLAGVDVGHDEHDGTRERVRRLGRLDCGIRQHQQGHVAPLFGRAERLHPHERARRAERVDDARHLGGRARLGKVGDFRTRPDVHRGGLCRRRRGDEQRHDNDEEARHVSQERRAG
jgi:hypothetical protein